MAVAPKFNATIDADISKFMRKAATVDKTIRDMASGVVVDIGANIREFVSEVNRVDSTVQEITSGENNVEIGLRIAELMSEVARVQTVIAELTRERDIDLDADTGDADREITGLWARLRALSGRNIVVDIQARWKNYKNTMGQISNFSKSMGEIASMTAGGLKIAMSPAIVPVLASVVGLIGQLGPMLGTVAGSTFALGSAFGTAGIGAAAFGAIAVTNLKDVFKAGEELKKLQEDLAKADTGKERTKILEEMARVQGSLNKEQQKGLDALNGLKKTWSDIAGSFQSETLTIFTKSLNIMSGVLVTLKPMFEGVMDAAMGLTDSLGKAINAKPMQDFFNYLNTTAGPMLSTITKAVGNFFSGFFSMMVAFGPLATETAGSFLKMSESFAAWGASLGKNQQFQAFVAYVSENMPKIRSIIGDAIVGIINTFAAFAPSSSDMMTSLQNMMTRFREWSAALSESQGFQNFVNYIKENGPKVVDLIGNITTFIVNMGIALAPLGAKMLGLINSFISWTNALMESHPMIGRVVAVGLVLSGVILAMMPHVIGLATLFFGLPTAMTAAVIGMVKTAAAFVAKWTVIAVTSTINAAKVAASWVVATGVKMVTAVAKMIASAAVFVAKWALIGAKAALGAAKTAAAWTLSTGAALATATGKMIATSAVFVAKWVWMGVQAMAQAARMAAAWFIALGPVGWVIAAVVGLAILIIANWDKIKAATSRIWSAVSDYVSQAWKKAQKFTQDGVAKIIVFVAKLPGKVLEFRSKMLSAGADLIRGLIKGAVSMAGDAISSIKRIAGDMVDAALSFFKIKSPSRVFMEMGAYVSEGLANGVSDKAKLAVDNVSRMAAEMSSAFNPQLAMADMHASARLDTSINRADMGVVRKSFAAEIDSGEQGQPIINVFNEWDGDKVVARVERTTAKKSRLTDGFYGK